MPFKEVEQRPLDVPRRIPALNPGFAGQVQPVEDFAPDIELELTGGLVANTHRSGVLIAG